MLVGVALDKSGFVVDTVPIHLHFGQSVLQEGTHVVVPLGVTLPDLSLEHS